MATADYDVRTCAALKFEKDVSPAQLAQQAGEEVELDTAREVVDVPDLRQAGDKEGRVKGDEMKKGGDIGERCQKHLEPLSYKTLICKCWKGVRFHKLPKHNRSLKNAQQLFNYCAGARTVTRCLGSRKSVTTDISKDAQHGALMLREILDPNRDPLEEGRSILQRFFPDQSAWIFIHGDTGNGYRSYEVRICKILLVLLESRRCWPTCRRSSRILVCELCNRVFAHAMRKIFPIGRKPSQTPESSPPRIEVR